MKVKIKKVKLKYTRREVLISMLSGGTQYE